MKLLYTIILLLSSGTAMASVTEQQAFWFKVIIFSPFVVIALVFILILHARNNDEDQEDIGED